jgi:hypothetical protein
VHPTTPSPTNTPAVRVLPQPPPALRTFDTRTTGTATAFRRQPRTIDNDSDDLDNDDRRCDRGLSAARAPSMMTTAGMRRHSARRPPRTIDDNSGRLRGYDGGPRTLDDDRHRHSDRCQPHTISDDSGR